ncbi:phage capsid protein, partial [Acinetobacter baumannii]|nr:phage capsid protein [Acinetobacter baumannii]
MAEENVTTETTEQVDTQKEAVEYPKHEYERTFTLSL